MANERLPRLRRARRGLSRLETWLAAASLLALLILSVAQILARNLLETGVPGADVLTRELVLYVTFLGAVLAVDAERHIKIDVICACLPVPWLERLFRPVHAAGAAVCALLAVAAARFWWDEWLYSQADERWVTAFNLILPAGFTLLALHFLLAAVGGPLDGDEAP